VYISFKSSSQDHCCRYGCPALAATTKQGNSLFVLIHIADLDRMYNPPNQTFIDDSLLYQSFLNTSGHNTTTDETTDTKTWAWESSGFLDSITTKKLDGTSNLICPHIHEINSTDAPVLLNTSNFENCFTIKARVSILNIISKLKFPSNFFRLVTRPTIPNLLP